MKLLLRSDFIDYYDHHFDTLDRPRIHMNYQRMSRVNYTRHDNFLYMRETLNLLTPEFGIVEDMHRRFRFSTRLPDVVVYIDDKAHQGDGKEKLGLEEAMRKYPQSLCSMYLKEEPSTSYRVVAIGEDGPRVWLKYQSLTHPWKSNVGDVEVEKVAWKGTKKPDRGHIPNIVSYNSPIFAVDFVAFNGNLYAIDFNHSPLLRWTGIEELVEPKMIVKEIRKWMIRAMH